MALVQVAGVRVMTDYVDADTAWLEWVCGIAIDARFYASPTIVRPAADWPRTLRVSAIERNGAEKTTLLGTEVVNRNATACVWVLHRDGWQLVDGAARVAADCDAALLQAIERADQAFE